MSQQYSRRFILGAIGSAGLASTIPATHAFAQYDDRPFFFFTDVEAQFMAAICDTLIPEDDFPSASQAGVVDFIDLQMAGPYGQGAGLYMQGPFPAGTPQQGYQLPLVPSELIRQGIAAADAELGGIGSLDAPAREAFVTDLSEGKPDLGDIPAKSFFDEVWKLTNQGYFADPIYGGNADYAGWKMVGFPGAHAYYTSFVEKHNRPYPQPPMGISHKPGGSGSMPRVIKQGG